MYNFFSLSFTFVFQSGNQNNPKAPYALKLTKENPQKAEINTHRAREIIHEHIQTYLHPHICQEGGKAGLVHVWLSHRKESGN
jgi:hypothetical protein